MNTLGKALAGMILVTGALSLPAMAETGDTRAQCESQVSSFHPDVDDMRFVSKRNFRDGTRIQYAVKNVDEVTGYEKVTLAVCWLGNENFQAGLETPADDLVADTVNSNDYGYSGPTVEFLSAPAR